MTVLEGEVELLRHGDGRVEVVSAPPVIRVALSLLVAADPYVVKANGNTLTFAGQVVYRVRGWDGFCSALVCDLDRDRRLS